MIGRWFLSHYNINEHKSTLFISIYSPSAAKGNYFRKYGYNNLNLRRLDYESQREDRPWLTKVIFVSFIAGPQRYRG